LGYSRHSEQTPSAAAGLLLRHGDAATSDALSKMTAWDDFHNWSGVGAETAAALPKKVRCRHAMGGVTG